MRSRCTLLAFAAVPTLAVTSALAQQHGFAVLHKSDTVAVERFERADPKWSGTLELRKQPRGQLEVWTVVRAPDKGVVLMEVSEKEPPADARQKPRLIQEARLIFKEDSVAIDAVTNGGLVTRLYQTRKGAMPYLNLSFATVELALDEARRLSSGSGPVTVPLFNLAGGHTVDAVVTLAGERATVQVGSVIIECALLPDGRIRTATIAAQDLRADRLP